MHYRIREYGQWLSGIHNKVADSLSQDMDRTDHKLTHIPFTHVPSQSPPSFEIVPLSNKIISWVTSLLQKLPMQNKAHKSTTLGCGNYGKNTVNPQASKMINSSRNSQETTKDIYLVLLPWLYVKGDFQDSVILPWLLAQSAVPLAMWQQPSGVMDIPTQHMMNKESPTGT
jgi:hypothetical protein